MNQTDKKVYAVDVALYFHAPDDETADRLADELADWLCHPAEREIPSCYRMGEAIVPENLRRPGERPLS